MNRIIRKRIDVPRSGWRKISKNGTRTKMYETKSVIKLSRFSLIDSRNLGSARIKETFANSEGWMYAIPKSSHLSTGDLFTTFKKISSVIEKK